MVFFFTCKQQKITLFYSFNKVCFVTGKILGTLPHLMFIPKVSELNSNFLNEILFCVCTDVTTNALKCEQFMTI